MTVNRTFIFSNNLKDRFPKIKLSTIKFHTIRPLKHKPFYPWLLVFSYILHFNQQNDLILSGGEILKLLLLFSMAALFIAGAAYLYLKDPIKSIFFSFLVLLIEFYTPPAQETIRSINYLRILASYSILVPILISGLLFSLIHLKKSQRPAAKRILFLNTIFCIFIIISTIQILISKQEKIKVRDRSGHRAALVAGGRNIYLLIADEYAGNDQLEMMFNYKNNRLKPALESRGFHWVDHPRSNYNFTPFSMASIFQMDYLKEIQPNSRESSQRNIAFNYINKNELVNILKEHGYQITNASLFRMGDKAPVSEGNGFYENGFTQVLSQTFHGKLTRELSYHLITTFDLPYFQNNYLKDLRKNIDKTKTRVLTVDTASNNFIYGHFIMPHYPYLYDSAGNALGYKQAMNTGDRHTYIEYLQYCNGFLLQLIDTVQKRDHNSTIILMSDHGFTKYDDPRLLPFNFHNFISIYYPDEEYSQLPDTLTNVNLFRTICNKQFGLKLPALPHREIPLIEK